MKSMSRCDVGVSDCNNAKKRRFLLWREAVAEKDGWILRPAVQRGSPRLGLGWLSGVCFLPARLSGTESAPIFSQFF